MIPTTLHFPPIPMKFDPNLLSTPIFRYDADYLLKIAQWLEEKILSPEFRKMPETVGKLIIKHQQIMELYERAKIEEREAKEKTHLKAQAPFYRPKLSNRNNQRLFERLDDRRKTSVFDRKNNTISKIRKTNR